jgi:hypothetical protein
VVTLHDGRKVDSSSQDWQLECLARHVLRLPTRQDRLAWLADVERRNGHHGNLRARMNALLADDKPRHIAT